MGMYAACEAVKKNDSQQTNKRENEEELETWTIEKKTRDVLRRMEVGRVRGDGWRGRGKKEEERTRKKKDEADEDRVG